MQAGGTSRPLLPIVRTPTSSRMTSRPVICVTEVVCLSHSSIGADVPTMDTTTKHICNKTFNECEHPR